MAFVMSISKTNPDQKLTNIGSSDSDNNTYFQNLEMSEHMFDKVLTISDVGKLNRIVIPKRLAVKYFPTISEDDQDCMLDFTDRNDKMWRFGYLNSGQSYMITNGWSRFVEENKLLAGDTVYFYRGYIHDENRRRRIMCINWKLKEGRENLGLGVNGEDHNERFVLKDNLQWNLSRAGRLAYDLTPPPSSRKKLKLFGVDVVEYSSSAETHGEMYASSSSFRNLSDDEGNKRKRKAL